MEPPPSSSSQTCPHPERKPCTHCSHSLILPQPLAAPSLLSISMESPVRNVSYQWNPTARAWLLPLGRISWFIHVAACVRTSFLWLNNPSCKSPNFAYPRGSGLTHGLFPLSAAMSETSEYPFSPLSCAYLGVESLSRTVTPGLTCGQLPDYFWQQLHQFAFPTAGWEKFGFSLSLPTPIFWGVFFFHPCFCFCFVFILPGQLSRRSLPWQHLDVQDGRHYPTLLRG